MVSTTTIDESSRVLTESPEFGQGRKAPATPIKEFEVALRRSIVRGTSIWQKVSERGEGCIRVVRMCLSTEQ